MIRLLRSKDVDEVMRIWLESTLKAHPFISEEYWLENYKMVKDTYIPLSKTYVLEDNSRIRGFISIIDELFIGALFVEILHQGEGIGRRLIELIAYYAHCISRTGSYLSEVAGIPEGESIAYLIAPPLEAMYALDVALKSANVELVAFYGPPSETNFGGGLLTGSQSACKAACDAFAEAVKAVAANPLGY